MERNAARHGAATLDPPVQLEVERERARFGAWYELFPRSFGGLRGVQEQLPRLRELGFDILYLPPIHPIGRPTARAATTRSWPARRSGCPWAIGDARAAMTRSTPSSARSRTSTRCAPRRRAGIEIALDLAIQSSPDHPWLNDHPEWFIQRPDGTLKYAENPPKKYQDIYNVNWDTPDWRALWEALRERHPAGSSRRAGLPRRQPAHQAAPVLGVADRARSTRSTRDVVFLAEAFTRRAMMRQLAKVGFTQSYTYFTWKNARWELTEYVDELAGARRGVLPAQLLRQHAGHPQRLPRRTAARPAFYTRFMLAATLSPTYGIYSGYEHVREHARPRGLRGVPGLGEVRGQGAPRSTARCCRYISG